MKIFTNLKLLFLSGAVVYSIPALSQVNYSPNYASNPKSPLAKISSEESFNNGWIRIKDSISITPRAFLNKYKFDLGLTSDDELIPSDTVIDKQNNIHYKYKQFHKGILVIGSDYSIHEKNRRVYLVHGKLAENLQVNSIPVISELVALRSSVALYQKKITNRKINNTIIDKVQDRPELVFVKNYSSSYSGRDWHLSWKVPVGNTSGVLADVFIDANSGEEIKTLERVIPGVGHSFVKSKSAKLGNVIPFQLPPSISSTFTPLYSRYLAGSNSLTFNSELNNSAGPNLYRTITFILNQVNGYQPLVWSAYTGSSYAPNNYPYGFEATNTTTNWGSNYNQATTAQWIAAKYYDYLIYNYGRYGINITNNSTTYKIGKIMVGAANDDVAYYGKINNSLHLYHIGSYWGIPLVTLDVVGHELTHALIRETANLVYENESGALNESLADIFGTMTERFALPNNWNWDIGEDGVQIRSMSNPNISYAGQPNQPDTYTGIYWQNTNGCSPSNANDQCWVHTNSGVMNKWFYLVSTGGTFNGRYVNGIGADVAQQITYWALANYLQTHSTYSDARWSTMAAARDIFGECSTQYNAVVNAWNACNVITAGCAGSGSRLAAAPVEALNPLQIKVFPNPATDYIKIQLPDHSDLFKIEITDINGRVLKTFSTSESIFTFDTKGYQTGTYMIKVQNKMEILVEKFIISQR